MFFNQNGILNIDEAIMNKESFKKIMADGIVTEDEIKEQSDKVVGLFQEIEKILREIFLMFRILHLRIWMKEE